MPDKIRDMIFFKVVKAMPGRSLTDVADGVFRLPQGSIVVAPRRAVSVDVDGQTIQVSAATDSERPLWKTSHGDLTQWVLLREKGNRIIFTRKLEMHNRIIIITGKRMK